MEGHRGALPGAYWRYQQMTSGDRAQRLGAQEHRWAIDVIEQTVHARPVGDVIEMLDQLLSAPGADPVLIGAGPLEDLLSARPEAGDAVASHCRRSQHADVWRRAVAAVWLRGHHHDTLSALAPFLSGPIDRT